MGSEVQGRDKQQLVGLLVEDREDNDQLLEELARRLPIELDVAASMSDALRRLHEREYDVVLLDRVLPDSAGTKWLRDAAWMAERSAVVVLTSVRDEDIALEAVQHGAQDYLVKGHIDLEALTRSTRYAVERHRSQAELRRYARRLEAMHEIDRAILARQSPEYISRLCLAHLTELVACDRASITFFDFEHDEAYVVAVVESRHDRIGPAAGTRLPLSEYPLHDMATLAETRYTRDLTGVPELPLLQARLTESGMRSVASAPLRTGERTMGEVNVGSIRPDAFSADDLDIAAEMARQLAIALNEARLRDLEERSEQQSRLASVGQMVAGIVHDFNNVLQGILGYSEILEEDESLSDAAKGHVRAITELTERAGQVNRQLLDFSRQSVTEKDEVDVGQLALDFVGLLSHTLPDNVRVEADVAGAAEALCTFGSATQLQQVLMNLAVNARDAMPAGGKLTISVRPERVGTEDTPPMPGLPAGDWIKIRVEDEGTGISSDVLPRIFEPFFTTKARSKGTGLGLAQVHGIVAEHGGYIDVMSEPGRGTTFVIYLPVAGVPASTSPRAPLPVAVPSGQRLLLVEDHPGVRDATARMLETGGFKVVAPEGPKEALEAFQSEPDSFAVAILDVMMPEMGGLEVLNHLWRLRPGLPVIIMSGYQFGPEARDLVERGAVRALQKPVSRNEIVGAVETALGAQMTSEAMALD